MKLPRLEQYLESLPRGLDSYPDHLQKASVYRQFLEETDLGGLVGFLPARLAHIVREPALSSEWIPEVHATALYVAAGEHLFKTEGAYVEHWRQVNRAVLESRLYRVLMVVASPKIVLSGADKRWGSLHRGVGLEVRTTGEGEAEVRLSYAPHLYNRLIVDCFGQAFRAAVEAAGGEDVTAETERYAAHGSLTRLRWR